MLNGLQQGCKQGNPMWISTPSPPHQFSGQSYPKWDLTGFALRTKSRTAVTGRACRHLQCFNDTWHVIVHVWCSDIERFYHCR